MSYRRKTVSCRLCIRNVPKIQPAWRFERSVAAERRCWNAKLMKRTDKSKNGNAEKMLTEYNFIGKKGVRGKYYQAYRCGHSVRVYREDGGVSV